VKTIALAAAKGGVGKTTLTAALATAAAILEPGTKVGLVDLEPQGSLTRWWNQRSQPEPHLLPVDPGAVARLQRQLRGGSLDYLILDCPPGFSGILEGAIAVSDLVLIPTGPGELDLAAVASTAEMAAAAGGPFRQVLNRAPFHSRLTGRAVTALRDGGKLLCQLVHHRVATAEAMADGHTALETVPDRPAARELMSVWLAVRAVPGFPPVRLSAAGSTGRRAGA